MSNANDPLAKADSFLAKYSNKSSAADTSKKRPATQGAPQSASRGTDERSVPTAGRPGSAHARQDSESYAARDAPQRRKARSPLQSPGESLDMSDDFGDMSIASPTGLEDSLMSDDLDPSPKSSRAVPGRKSMLPMKNAPQQQPQPARRQRRMSMSGSISGLSDSEDFSLDKPAGQGKPQEQRTRAGRQRRQAVSPPTSGPGSTGWKPEESDKKAPTAVHSVLKGMPASAGAFAANPTPATSLSGHPARGGPNAQGKPQDRAPNRSVGQKDPEKSMDLSASLDISAELDISSELETSVEVTSPTGSPEEKRPSIRETAPGRPGAQAGAGGARGPQGGSTQGGPEARGGSRGAMQHGQRPDVAGRQGSAPRGAPLERAPVVASERGRSPPPGPMGPRGPRRPRQGRSDSPSPSPSPGHPPRAPPRKPTPIQTTDLDDSIMSSDLAPSEVLSDTEGGAAEEAEDATAALHRSLAGNRPVPARSPSPSRPPATKGRLSQLPRRSSGSTPSPGESLAEEISEGLISPIQGPIRRRERRMSQSSGYNSPLEMSTSMLSEDLAPTPDTPKVVGAGGESRQGRTGKPRAEGRQGTPPRQPAAQLHPPMFADMHASTDSIQSVVEDAEDETEALHRMLGGAVETAKDSEDETEAPSRPPATKGRLSELPRRSPGSTPSPGESLVEDAEDETEALHRMLGGSDSEDETEAPSRPPATKGRLSQLPRRSPGSTPSPGESLVEDAEDETEALHRMLGGAVKTAQDAEDETEALHRMLGGAVEDAEG
ncbi:hypothetical protein CYMTET_21782 [Cymbomonas tetramitiformis]|uniref:Uncharacterized protein n=1 Tax=Cymbomonas tetramitiformis TaxID=36881 RepID=A0AAE0L2K2_9CHLO|nr:hypothetical protein CYMTET_21782 [Cymbomonas tetramitiformis]